MLVLVRCTRVSQECACIVYRTICSIQDVNICMPIGCDIPIGTCFNHPESMYTDAQYISCFQLKQGYGKWC